MALKNLATLWPVKKTGGKLVLAGDSKDGTHTFMVFKRTSKDGRYTMYDLCEKIDDEQAAADSAGDAVAGESEEDLPF